MFCRPLLGPEVIPPPPPSLLDGPARIDSACFTATDGRA